MSFVPPRGPKRPSVRLSTPFRPAAALLAAPSRAPRTAQRSKAAVRGERGVRPRAGPSRLWCPHELGLGRAELGAPAAPRCGWWPRCGGGTSEAASWSVLLVGSLAWAFWWDEWGGKVCHGRGLSVATGFSQVARSCLLFRCGGAAGAAAGPPGEARCLRPAAGPPCPVSPSLAMGCATLVVSSLPARGPLVTCAGAPPALPRA